jgi:uncharacterized protein (UPF0335 family)
MVSNAVFAKEQLLSVVQRVERLHEEKKGLENDIRDVFAEARGNGFDVKAIKEIVKLRRLDQGELDEMQAIIDTYLRAISEAERDCVTQPKSFIEHTTRAVA